MNKKRKAKTKKFKYKKCPYCNSSKVVAYGKVKKPEGLVQKYKCTNPDCSEKKPSKTGVYFTDKIKPKTKIVTMDYEHRRGKEYVDVVEPTIKKRYFISLLLEFMEATKSDNISTLRAAADYKKENRKMFNLKFENQNIELNKEKIINGFEPKLIICLSKINNTLKIIKIDEI